MPTKCLLTGAGDPSAIWALCSRALMVISMEILQSSHPVLLFHGMALEIEGKFSCVVPNTDVKSFVLGFYSTVTPVMGKCQPTGKSWGWI